MFLTLLSNGLKEEKLDDGSSRTLLSVAPALAPTKAAILPLVKKDGFEIGTDLYNKLKLDFECGYDEKIQLENATEDKMPLGHRSVSLLITILK